MDTSHLTLKSQREALSQAYAARVADITSKDSILRRLQAEIDHLDFSLGILANSIHSSLKKENLLSKPSDANQDDLSLRDAVRKLYDEGDTKGVQEVFDGVLLMGKNPTKATVNTTLHNLAQRNELVKVGKGVYMKPFKNERPPVIATSNSNAGASKVHPVS